MDPFSAVGARYELANFMDVCCDATNYYLAQ